jgi:hypothetical protein
MPPSPGECTTVSERPDQPHPDPAREREESTDLGYRDTEEERAYEQAAEEGSPSNDSEKDPPDRR